MLSAADIQATVNAIVTASASPPNQTNEPAPFSIASLTDSAWNGEVVRIEPSQGAIQDVFWNESSNLVVQSSAGTFDLNPSRWGDWQEAWSTNPHSDQTIIPSPDGSHHVLLENHMWIIRKFDGNPIGLIGDVPDTIRWISDGSAVVFAITNPNSELEQGLYAWPVSSPTPSLVLSEQSNAGSMFISPSGTRAAYLINTGVSVNLTLRLVELPSGDVDTLRLDLPQGWQITDWVSDELLELSVGLSSPSYSWFNVETETLYPVQGSEAEIDAAPPLPSPDGRWVAGDSIQVLSRETGEITTNQVEHVYFVTDLEHNDNHNIAFGDDSAIEYLSWSVDSQKLYLVSCPTHENAQASPAAPYGFLAYEPDSDSSHVLFGKALQVALNPSQQWAYVVFPSLNSDDERVLSGALWEVGSQSLHDRRVILDEFVYRNPIYRNGRQPAAYFYARWSHDGRKLIIVTPDGRLVLYHLGGQPQVLHDNLFEDLNWIDAMAALQSGGIFWSPNDHYILFWDNEVLLIRVE